MDDGKIEVHGYWVYYSLCFNTPQTFAQDIRPLSLFNPSKVVIEPSVGLSTSIVINSLAAN